MADQILSSQGVYFGEFNLTSRLSGISSDYTAEAKDNTVLQMNTRSRRGGLKDGVFNFEGFFNPDSTDAGVFDYVNTANVPITITSQGETVGNTCHMMQAITASLNPHDASIGELIGFSLNAQLSNNPLVRGYLMLDSVDSTLTATGNGTGVQFASGIASGQTMYAFLHVIAMGGGGGSIDFKIVSDDNASFTSATDRITFTSASAATSEVGTVAGAVSDDYYRVEYTVTGTVACQAVIGLGIV